MAKRLWLVLALGLALIGARPALADVWDVATNNDNTPATENDLVHGSDQIHDLGDVVAGTTADEDWFTVGEAGRSSYEVVVDGTTGDIGGVTIERTDAAGTLPAIQTGTAVGVGYSQHLAWDQGSATSVEERIRVTSSDCPNCDTNDQYRIRFYDTTCAIARFNNSATQITIIILQNTTSGPVGGHFYLWNGTGTLVNTTTNSFNLAANAAFVQNTSIPAIAPGTGGSVTITNDSGYGAVAGKGVAVEPATGFTFDTAMSCRPH